MGLKSSASSGWFVCITRWWKTAVSALDGTGVKVDCGSIRLPCWALSHCFRTRWERFGSGQEAARAEMTSSSPVARLGQRERAGALRRSGAISRKPAARAHESHPRHGDLEHAAQCGPAPAWSHDGGSGFLKTVAGQRVGKLRCRLVWLMVRAIVNMLTHRYVGGIQNQPRAIRTAKQSLDGCH